MLPHGHRLGSGQGFFEGLAFSKFRTLLRVGFRLRPKFGMPANSGGMVRFDQLRRGGNLRVIKRKTAFPITTSLTDAGKEMLS
jgi:hypothetical protein